MRKLGLIALCLLLAGCVQPEPPVPTDTVTPTPTPARPFTVLTSRAPLTADPAAAEKDTDLLIVANVYQRLLRVDAVSKELKPDAADCLFVSEKKYQCTLIEGVTFHDGQPVTAKDVQFSINRALRLSKAAATNLGFASLRRITTSDDKVVNFELTGPDNQFGYALSSPSASILPAEHFDPDSFLPLETPAVGSGPYKVEECSADTVVFSKFADYAGPNTGHLDELVLRVQDATAAEETLAAGEAEAVWRTLSDTAIDRILAGSEDSPKYHRFPLDGQRVTRLMWNTQSEYFADDELREAVSEAVQGDRTLDSLIPQGIEGYSSAFPKSPAKVKTLKGARKNLTLGYDATAPGMKDLALVLRDRIEEIGSISVQVQDRGDTDLQLTDLGARTNSAGGWLQAYLDRLPQKSTDDVVALVDDWITRPSSSKEADVDKEIDAIQAQAVKDATVLPISQEDGILILAEGVTTFDYCFGSGGELGLWGLQHE
ncbi:MAG: ABC transporter substrate-binding protein [Propionibacteriaceae bacterium]|jgi:peptide/nickel transport system substrate-binding protein|nr:ABC transporter substrate-binding protein [Propionibacteriaceae bacterium]